MSDLSAGRITEEEEERLLGEALERVREKCEDIELDHAFFEEQVQLLESLSPPTWPVDRRIELAWAIVRQLGTQIKRSLSRRAFYAAFPPDSSVADPLWARKWMTALGALEFWEGNTHVAWKLQASALKKARELGDRIGECTQLGNMANWASSTAQFETALALTSAAIEAAGPLANADHLRAIYVNRANALFRLGRHDDALAAGALACACVEPPITGRVLHHLVVSQVHSSEVLIELGRVAEARALLGAAQRFAAQVKVPEVEACVSRGAAQLQAAEGCLREGLLNLEAGVQTAEAGGGDGAGDGQVLDCLHAMYRIQRRAGDRDAALQSLNRIGAVYMRNAENALRMSQEALAAPPLFAAEDKLGEVDRYLALKAAEARTASHGNLRSWGYLLDAAARASGIEDATWEHCPRVARLALLVAPRLGLTSDQAAGVEAGALLHDVGKLGVADIILRNTETLDDKEAELYNTHAEAGAQLLERADIPHKRTVIDVVRLHHTPYDGRGERAANLQGEAIPLAARIVAACDAFDALVMGRPRRAAMPVPEALKEILRQSGRDFDPRVVDALIETVRQLQREHGDVMQYLSDAAVEIEYFATQRMLRRATLGEAN